MEIARDIHINEGLNKYENKSLLSRIKYIMRWIEGEPYVKTLPKSDRKRKR